ncbi:MAG: hypothetical protein U9R79_02390 [Armatimonadota bacterium]|nr:hypothetical protein [Armatimonadota bacterium]
MTDEALAVEHIELPIEQLPAGEIAPPMEPDHPSWAVLEGWDDPLAPRAGYRLPSGKRRVERGGRAALEFESGGAIERALVTGEETWRELAIECEMQGLQEEAGPTNDDWMVERARAGLVFRAGTSRRHYFLCLEGLQQLVLYRRIDQEWLELASAAVDYDGQVITLRVELDADGIRASCAELGVEMFATDTTIQSGRAGFRSLGGSRLLSLSVELTPSQQRTNRRVAEGRRRAVAAEHEALPPAEQVDELCLPAGHRLLEAIDLRGGEDNDLLLRGPDGLVARDWEGTELWRFADDVSQVKVASEPTGGSRRIYALVGRQRAHEQVSVRGDANVWTVASQIVVLDGATGGELARRDLPEDPHLNVLRQYDLSNETGRLAGDEPVDIIVRHWRQDLGHGGRDLWAFDGQLDLLWHAEVDPPYGHHNAVHLVDLTGDGRSEVVTGGTTLSADGEVIAVHDLAHEMSAIRGAGHYDAVAAGHFECDPDRDPVAFLIAGSAGVYVTDPLSGRTRAVHRIGHAQGVQECRVREDIPGRQALAHTRWGNMGITTLLSGLGDRLWTIQPHFIPGTRPVQWLPEGPQHLWVCPTRQTLALYDGRGRRIRELEALQRAWGDRPATQVRGTVLRRSPEGRDLLALTIDERILLFGPTSA